VGREYQNVFLLVFDDEGRAPTDRQSTSTSPTPETAQTSAPRFP
jgi:hypothetical protein